MRLRLEWLIGANHEEFSYLLLDVPGCSEPLGKVGDVARACRDGVAVFVANRDSAFDDVYQLVPSILPEKLTWTAIPKTTAHQSIRRLVQDHSTGVGLTFDDPIKGIGISGQGESGIVAEFMLM